MRADSDYAAGEPPPDQSWRRRRPSSAVAGKGRISRYVRSRRWLRGQDFDRSVSRPLALGLGAHPYAPDLSKDRELLARYGLEDVGEAGYLHEHLDAAQIGLTHYRLLPNRRPDWAHRHSVVEEIYVTLTGTGQIIIDEQSVDLRPLVAVRVAPASARERAAGPDGLEVLALGTHWPGDGKW